MKFRIFSDIHLDFDSPDNLWKPVGLREDSETILILAGDLWHSNLAFTNVWMQEICARFHAVIIVLGNHDYWNLSLQSAVRKAKDTTEQIENCYVMENDFLTIGYIKIIGSTLWTDFWNNPIAELQAKHGMNDYRKTTYEMPNNTHRKLHPSDTIKAHNISKKFIFENAIRDFTSQKIVVVTHMAPSLQSIDGYYKNSLLNPAYASDLSNQILDSQISLWVHGHMHCPVDYMIGNTRVFSNPRGYNRYEETGYSEKSMIQL